MNLDLAEPSSDLMSELHKFFHEYRVSIVRVHGEDRFTNINTLTSIMQMLFSAMLCNPNVNSTGRLNLNDLGESTFVHFHSSIVNVFDCIKCSNNIDLYNKFKNNLKNLCNKIIEDVDKLDQQVKLH